MVLLAKAAREAMVNSYAPYSRLHVGAAVLASDKRIFTGCNVENAAFGATICAERVAISKAISEGVKAILAVAVVSDALDPLPPCGICMQVISEFSTARDVRVMAIGKNGKIEKFKLGELFSIGKRVSDAIRSATS